MNVDTQIFNKILAHRIQQKIKELYTVIQGGSTKDARQVQYLKTNQYNPPKQAKEKNPWDHINQ